MIHQKESTTDPESGYFYKGEHKKILPMQKNTCCDQNGFILDFEVTPGNVHGSVPFVELYKRIKEREHTRYYVMDAGYKIPAIARALLEDGKVPVFPYKRAMSKDVFFKHEYVYDEHFDCYICPYDQILKYSAVKRDGYRVFKSDKEKCKACPYRNRCTEIKDCVKTVTWHIWTDYMEK